MWSGTPASFFTALIQDVDDSVFAQGVGGGGRNASFLEPLRKAGNFIPFPDLYI
jgi:hypothetical protein